MGEEFLIEAIGPDKRKVLIEENDPNYTICEACGRVVHENLIKDTDNNFCELCFHDEWDYCELCEKATRFDQSRSNCEGHFFCERCADNIDWHQDDVGCWHTTIPKNLIAD